MLFKELYSLYWTKHARLRLKCPANVRYWWTAYQQQWSDRPADAITHSEVQDWFDRLALSSKSSAVRALNQLAAILNWGRRRGYLPTTNPNPCAQVERLKLQSRERFLLPDELTRFKLALSKEPQIWQDFFWMCLLTGARRGNVQSMRWDELDTTLAIWRIPPDKYKNGKSHHVALTAPALAILYRRQTSPNQSPYVFASTGTRGHLVEVRRAWRRILKRASLTDLRPHDLRRTLGSYMAISGQGLPMIGNALGHLDARSTQVYAKLYLEPVRRALSEAQEAFLNP